MTKEILRPYSRCEEIWSASIHGLGILLGVAAIAILVTLSAIYQGAWAVVACSIFGASIVLAYLASTLYHAVDKQSLKAKLKKFDHVAIYYLIAGSYTPFLLVTIRSAWAWVVFGLIWALAILGTVLKLLSDGNGAKFWSIAMYLGMGWMSVFIVGSLVMNAPFIGVVFLAAGGLAYTLGVIFYVQKKKPYFHAIWHLFVLAGTVLHFFAVLYSCVLI